MDFGSFISKGLEPDYRGSVRFSVVNWGSFVDELIQWSYDDYELTDTAIRLALAFYKGIPIESIERDREVGGAVLKSVYMDRLSLITGLDKDNPSLIRALLKVPEGVGCVNLFEKVSDNVKGLYKPMFRTIAHRPCSFDQMIKYGISGFRFNKFDGDVFIDLENRSIHWECMKMMYQFHNPLIEFLTKQVRKYFFSSTSGGVIVTPEGTEDFGDGVDTVFGDFSNLGYRFAVGLNGTYTYRNNDKENLDKGFYVRKEVSGTACPKCSSKIFKGKESWICIDHCGLEIPFYFNKQRVSESFALEYLDQLAS